MAANKSNQQQYPGSVNQAEGYRVVRGPNWNRLYEDNGEGFQGTIVSTEQDCMNPVSTITVVWDSGRKLRYDGRENKYDLRLLETGPTGCMHPKKKCISCGSTSIKGIRWKCKKCRNINICTKCYMNDCHKISHPFYRINTPESQKVLLMPRSNTEKTTAMGICVGAEVIRGPDWKRHDTDGGDVGYVRTSSPEKGEVSVLWKHSEQTTTCRVGAEGCVDVVFSRLTETATGGQYYADHLPVVEEAIKHFRVVIVGDGAVGATALLWAYTKDEFYAVYVPTVFETYVKDITIRGVSDKLKVTFEDTAGQEDYDRLRPLSYPDIDVALICYSVVSPDSLENVTEKWLPEVRHFLKKMPIVLIGCKTDLLKDKDTLDELEKLKQKVITTEQGANLAEDIGAVYFFECSVITQEGRKHAQECINEALRVVLTSTQSFKSLLQMVHLQKLENDNILILYTPLWYMNTLNSFQTIDVNH